MRVKVCLLSTFNPLLSLSVNELQYAFTSIGFQSSSEFKWIKHIYIINAEFFFQSSSEFKMYLRKDASVLDKIFQSSSEFKGGDITIKYQCAKELSILFWV